MAAFPQAHLYCPFGEPKPHESAIYVHDEIELLLFQGDLISCDSDAWAWRAHISYFTDGALLWRYIICGWMWTII